MSHETPPVRGSSSPAANLLSRRGFVGSAVASGVAGSLAVGVGLAGGCNQAQRDSEPHETAVATNPRLFTFVGGRMGAWSVIATRAVVGEAITAVEKLEIVSGSVGALPEGAAWLLRGATSNERYATRSEKDVLVAKQAALGRPDATYGALIPIRKNEAWWKLSQDERRAIFEDRSHHVQTGLKYLPGVARRLHHCRDLGGNEPFDFLTLFDYAKTESAAFEDMVGELRATEEWKFVEREVDIRLVRDRA